MAALAASAPALGDFGDFSAPNAADRPDPVESPRVKTPNDPDFDRCEPDDEDSPPGDPCSSYWSEQYQAFGFGPESSTAVYTDPSQLDQQGRDANLAAGRDELAQIAGVRADTAWKYSTGSPDVVIAIFDNGIEWQERELIDKVHLNTRELPKPQGAADYDRNGDGRVSVSDWDGDPRVSKTGGDSESDLLLDASDLLAAFSDGSDADGNGYVDDIAGWDFLHDDNDPLDSSDCCLGGHGTGRAEEAGAEGDNERGKLGLCPACMIMPLRTSDSIVHDTNLIALGTVYAADNGASVTECACGGLLNSSFARRAFAYADSKGVAQMMVSSDVNSANHNYPTNYNEAIYVSGSLPDTAPGENCEVPSLPAIGGGAEVPGCKEFLDVLSELSGGRLKPSSQPATTSFFRNANLTQYGGKADIVLMGATGSENTGQSAGAAGLVQSYARERFAGQSQFPKALSGNEVRQLLTMSAEDVKPGNTGVIGLPDKANLGWDPHFGYGRVNLAKAMAMVLAGRIPPEAQLDAPDWFAPINVDRVGSGGVPIKGRLAAPHSSGGVGEWRVEYACGQDALDEDFEPVPGASGSGARNGTLGTLSKALLERLADGCDGSIANDAGLPAGRPTQPWPADPYPSPDPMRHAFQIRLTVEEAGDEQNIGRYRKTLFAHRNDGALDGWPRPIGSGSVPGELVTGSGGEASPRLADLNADDRLDVLLPTSSGELYALDARGEPLPSWNRGKPVLTRPYAQGAAHQGAPGIAGDPPREALRTPAVGDVTGDGEPDVLVTAGEHLHAWSRAGRELPGFPQRVNPAHSEPCKGGAARCFDESQRAITEDNHVKRGYVGSPALADLDEDGRLDIVTAALDQHVYAYSGTARLLPGFPRKLVHPDAIGGSETINTPTIADLDGDRDPEIVVATNEVLDTESEFPGTLDDLFSAFLSATTGATPVHAIHGDGTPVAGWPIKLGALVTDLLPTVGPGHDAAAFDIDGDGSDEVVVAALSADAKLVDGNGTTIRRFDNIATVGSVLDPTLQVNAFDYASVGDFTGDSAPEVAKGGVSLGTAINLIASNQNVPHNHVVQGWDPRSGRVLPGFPVATDDFQLLSQPVFAKVDGSGGGRQAIVGTGLYQLHAYGANGAEPAGWPKFTGGWIFATPAVGDIDGDGKLEVTTVTREGWSFAWRTDAPACQAGSTSTNSEWWTFHHDEHGTADYGHDARPPSRPGALSVRKEGADLRLSFAGSGDDLRCGSAARYEVRGSDREIDDGGDFVAARRIDAAAAARRAAAGDPVTLVARGAARYDHVAVRALDEAGNASYLRAEGEARSVREEPREREPEAPAVPKAEGEEGGPMPFTGLTLLLLLLAGLLLLALGAALARRLRRA